MRNETRLLRLAGSSFENSDFFRHLSFVIRIWNLFRHWSFVIRISVKAFAKLTRERSSTFRTQEDRLPGRAFDFDAVGFDRWIVLERVVDDAAVKGVHRFQF